LERLSTFEPWPGLITGIEWKKYNKDKNTFGWKDKNKYIKINCFWDNFIVNIYTSKAVGIKKTYLERQYLLFLFLKYHCKKFLISKLFI